MWSLTKIIFIVIGLYLIVVGIMDMMRDSDNTNIGIQAVSVAIGGGLLAYGFQFTPIKSLVDSIVGGVAGVVVTAVGGIKTVVEDGFKGIGKVAKDVTK